MKGKRSASGQARSRTEPKLGDGVGLGMHDEGTGLGLAFGSPLGPASPKPTAQIEGGETGPEPFLVLT